MHGRRIKNIIMLFFLPLLILPVHVFGQSATYINFGNNPFKGDKDAKIIIIEFADYQCPFCARHFRETLPKIEKEYISSGKVKYVFLDYPFDFHKQAFKAAEAAHCAGEQEKYWEMHDQLFANQKAIEPNDLSEYAKAIGIDAAKFQQCLDNGKYAETIKKNITEGKKAGVKNLPCFLLGYTDPAKPNIVKAIKKIEMAQPYSKFNLPSAVWP